MMTDHQRTSYFNRFLNILEYLLVLLIKYLGTYLEGCRKKSITTPATSGNSFAPKLTYIHYPKIAVKFE